MFTRCAIIGRRKYSQERALCSGAVMAKETEAAIACNLGSC
jgi:hypothetical protein